MQGGPAAGIARYEELKTACPASAFDEQLLDEIAALLRRIGFACDAVQLLELNAREYPASWRVHASLGNAFASAGRRADAIGAYERALRLDPGQAAVRKKLDALRGGRP